MKNRIILGSILLLTLGTAVAGTFLYGQESAGTQLHLEAARYEATRSVEPTADTIALWKVNAVASTFMPPKIPL